MKVGVRESSKDEHDDLRCYSVHYEYKHFNGDGVF